MKKLFILLLSCAVVCGCGKVELSENKGNNDPNIPDDPKPEEDIFLQFCIENFDLDGDGTVSQYEADKVIGISCKDMGITKLTGIEKFSNLENLDCSGNKLVALDLSKNRHLTSVNCKRNSSLRSLSVGGCNELQTLDCSYCPLSSLDLSSATALQSVDCSNNALTTLNVGGCSALRLLDCSYNKLKTLDLSKTTGIVTVNCKRNSLTSLVLTGCTELVSLDCSYNSLTSLDVSDSLQLSTLDCSDNDSLKEVWLFASSAQKIQHLTKDNNTQIKYHHISYAIGDRYSENGKEGTVFYITDNGIHGKIVSLDKTECAWSTEKILTSATDENDGMVNMKIIQKISGWREKYPAFAWCADKGDDWYLPVINELKAIYDSGIINKHDHTFYWSSNEDGEWCAWMVGMKQNNTGIYNKDYLLSVRAVSAF